MKMGKFGVAVFGCGAALMLCSCSSRPADWEDAWVVQDIVASPAAADQLRIDGEVSPGEWDDAQNYNLARAADWGYGKLLPRQRKREDTTPFERGFFKVKYDADFLYVLAVLDDEDIVQTSREDQALSFDTGDMIEVFLKPEDKCAVWELYGTPWNNVTTLFYPWPGHTFRTQQKFHPGIKAAALARPAADPEKDKAGWTIEMAIPRELIEKTGGTFAPDQEWRILLCRYNYGKNLPFKQISSTPRLPRTNHMLVDYYAKLKFKKPPEEKKPAEAKPEDEAKKSSEVKPTAEEKKPEAPAAKPAAEEKKAPEKKSAEVKPEPEAEKAPEAKPVAEAKKPAEEKKAPEAKPSKPAEVKKPVAEAKKTPEAKKPVAEAKKPAAEEKKAPEKK